MIELICIFTTGGIILFQQQFSTLKSDLVDNLIKKNLINDRSSEKSYLYDSYRVMWKSNTDKKLIFMIAYGELQHLQYADVLLKLIEATYINEYFSQIIIKNNIIKSFPKFDEGFQQAVQTWQNHIRKEKLQKGMKTFEQTQKGQEIETKKKKKTSTKISTTSKYETNNENYDEKDNKRMAKKAEKNTIQKSTVVVENTEENASSSKIKKSKEKAIGTSQKIKKSTLQGLDFSHANKEEDIKKFQDQYLGGDDQHIKGFYDLNDLSSDEDEQNIKKRGFFASLSNSLKQLTGSKVLDAQDLQPVLEKFKDQLMSRNVAEQIAQQLCDSIKQNLLKTKSQAFTTLYKTVKESLQEAISKILTPKTNIDIISEALSAREKGKPYIITFIGVNGVGKSTNLAKVAYLFKTQGFSVMLAACDNFRAGAVEQIKTHGRCLNIPVYDKGYREEPADIAFQAIREATMKKIDILLIDTAGRMQDNEPLMKQLSKLVVMNNPDLILFIGEAVVGNDGTDQLMKFNKALVDLSPKENIKEIDGIILSKFDIVEDKVGAALSMTYNTGKPIVFCGVGQKYPHLKKLNVRTVVHALLN
ncbi:signal recognition particle receptor, putative [Ichthyophthirius multifiliis]|uniref:Signal recognition particle receptor, putative n=1 Tax=Ichthyophthirius multifiliis TaxID=5932 RepID=G0R1I6_ICHMU|nr:signal recognition particle receptor, putative [Ichthyophthirius multifiliis]EGR28659.1 signal recognition particle receptor, putative [Ichthyophthirius multifiliis]|eukprot:XP_004029895.1 signal recognition particle receptor, putative [Ichthyophthirius multifiliis]